MRAARALSTTRRAAGVLGPAPAASSHSDRWTHSVIVNVGEAGLGELIVQAVVPAAVAGHVDFQGVESVPVLPERSPQGRDRRLAKNFAMMTMAFPIQTAVTASTAEETAIRSAPVRTAWTVSAAVSEVLMKTSSQRTRPQLKAKKRMNSRMQR